MKIGIRISLAVLSGFLTVVSSSGWCASEPIPRPTRQSCGGEHQIAKPGGGYWTCTFDDEFDGNKLDKSQWTPQLTSNSNFTSGPPGYQTCYTDSSNNVSVSGGYLHLTVRKEPAPFTCSDPKGGFTTQYTAGEVTTVYGFHQTYGRFEVRAKLPNTALNGLQETLWLWPVTYTYGGWPYSGEIDFAEFYSQYANLNVPYIHYVYDPLTVNPSTQTNIVTAYNCSIDYTKFNTYTIIWEPGRITLMDNDSTCLVDNYVPSGLLTSPEPFDQPFFLALTQALGVGTNAYNPATTPLPASLQIDYVRVWK